MAYQLGPSAFGVVCLLTILTSLTCGGKVDVETRKDIEKTYFKSIASGICNGEKVDVKKVAKSIAEGDKICKSKGKDEVPVTCYLAEFGIIKSPTEAYEDQKKVAKNLQKQGWYTDNAIKKIVKEIYSQKCHKKFMDQSTFEEGSRCLMKAFVKVCDG